VNTGWIDGAAQQADEADEASGGTVARMEVPPHARADRVGRGHRFAAYPRCSADSGGGDGTDRVRVGALLVVASILAAGCRMPPGGGVSGTVLEPSGKPMEAAEVILSDEPEILGVVVPFEKPVRLVTKTDDTGHFRFFWSHGNRKRGPLLEVRAPGYASVSTQLGLGYPKCEVRLVPTITGGTSETRCSVTRSAGANNE
jgi:hypothetical protein